MKILVCLIAVLTMSCASTKSNSTAQQITHEVLLQGSNGGYTTPKKMIIKNQKELQSVYTQINLTRKPGYRVPKVNFKEEMVIALFIGEKSSGGYAISISKIEDLETEVHAFIKETQPEGMATMAITQPFYFCKIPRTEKQIVFK